jgi:hypothetical protein
MLVIGARDAELENVSVRVRGKEALGAKPNGEVVAGIFPAIKARRTCSCLYLAGIISAVRSFTGPSSPDSSIGEFFV